MPGRRMIDLHAPVLRWALIATFAGCAIDVTTDSSTGAQRSLDSSFAQPQSGVVAFVDANVVSMTSPAIARNQTLVVRAGVIEAVGPAAQVAIPNGAQRIDARGKYLMPGLVDFHVHLGHRTDLRNYLASGVTTVVHMGGSPSTVIAWRDSIRARTLVGPDIFAGAFLNGPLGRGGPQTVQTTENARDYVREAAANRHDFVKVYNSLTADQFMAVVDEAGKHKLPLLGHAVRSIGLIRGFAHGQRVVVHAEEYLYDTLRSQREDLIPNVVAATRTARVALVPNLSAYEAIELQWGRRAAVDSFLRTPQAAQLDPFWQQRWRNADYVTRQGQLQNLAFLKRLTLAMQRGGVTLLLGTDSPGIPGMFAGYSIHEDLRLLVSAGLSPYEALTAGTRSSGAIAQQEFRSDSFGTLEVGKRADILMLSANPLTNVAAARTPLAVMVRGRMFTPAQLREGR